MSTASAAYEEAPTVRVSSLAEATEFYLAALQPLQYGYISRIRHETATAVSDAVGLGPCHSNRVDLLLSQSLTHHRAHGKRHICFPATSRAVVRDFYANALNAGGQPFTAPSDSSDESGVFLSAVTDLDGNRVEVFFQGPGSEVGRQDTDIPRPTSNQIVSRWATDVARSVSVSSSARRSRSSEIMAGPHTPPALPAAAAPGSLRAPSSSAGSSSRPSRASATNSRPPSSEHPVGHKTVIGAVLGVAAAGALAYSVMRDHEDSSRRERDFASRMDERDRLRSEARGYVPLAASTTSRGVIEMRDEESPRRGRYDERRTSYRYDDRPDDMGDWQIKYRGRRRSSVADRDSGYYSHADSRPRDSNPDVGRYRSVYYPAPSTPSGPTRRSNSAASYERRALEYSPWESKGAVAAAPPPSSHHSRSRRSSFSRSSEDTIKPASRARTYDVEPGYRRDEGPVPGRAPSMPSAPAARSRSLAGRSHVSVSQPPSPPPMFRSSSNAGSSRSHRRDVVRTALPPSAAGAASALSHARKVSLPASEHGSRATRYSYKTAVAEQRADAPPAAASTAGSRRSSTHPERVALPPSSVGSGGTRLTQESLKAWDVPLPPSEVNARDRGSLEEMETVVPDDSISCVASRSSRRSKSSRRSRAPV